MTARAYSQPTIVLRMCGALAKLDGQTISACILADAVQSQFPYVPRDVLRVHAAMVLRVFYEPPKSADIQLAGLKDDKAAAVCEFLANMLHAEADDLSDATQRGAA